MNNLKVVIVDDDYLMIQNLIKLVDWKKMGFEIIATASNGKDALKILRKTHPSLLITDVIMPIMNGLELSISVRKEFPDMKILMLSSYDEFEYVKKAIEMGVTDYILKSEINAISFSSKLSQLSQQFSRESFLTSAANGQELSNFFESGRMTVPLNEGRYLDDLYNRKFQFFVFTQSICFETDAASTLKNWKSSVFSLSSIIHEIEEFRHADIIFTWHHYCILGMPLETNGSKRKYLVDSLCRKALFYVNGRAPHPCALFYSYHPMTPPDLRKFLQINQNVLRFFSYFPEKNPICFDSIDNLSKPNYIEKEFNFRSLLFSPEHLEDDILAIKEYLSHYIQQKNAHALSTFYINFCYRCQVNDISYFATPEYFQKWIYNTYQDYVKELSSDHNRTFNTSTKMAIDFIEKNFSNCDLSIKEISSHVSLSDGHLGVLFKADTGKTVTEYIADIRIKNAEYLLNNTTMKIYEVAESCGYKSSQYFSQIFYQKTGRRPIDYRRNKSQK